MNIYNVKGPNFSPAKKRPTKDLPPPQLSLFNTGIANSRFINELSPTLIKGELLKTISIADRPLPQAGVTIRTLSLEEAQQELHYIHTESIHGKLRFKHEDLLRSIDKDVYNCTAPSESDVSDIMQCPRDHFIICEMGDVGKGLATSKAIKAGEAIGVYTGVIEDDNISDLENTYLLTCVPPEHTNIISAQINPQKYGNLMKYIQHAPNKREDLANDINRGADILKNKIKTNTHALLRSNRIVEFIYKKNLEEEVNKCDEFSKYELKGISPKDVATANVIVKYRIVNNIFIPVLCALRDIEANEMLYFSYGMDGYWQNSDIIPVLFNKQGEIIPSEYYSYNKNSKSHYNLPLPKDEYPLPDDVKVVSGASCCNQLFIFCFIVVLFNYFLISKKDN